MQFVASLLFAIVLILGMNFTCQAEDPWFPQPIQTLTLPYGYGGIYSSSSGQLVYVGTSKPSLMTGDLKRTRLSLDSFRISSMNGVGITGDDEFVVCAGNSGLFVVDVRKKKAFPCEQLPGSSDSLAIAPAGSLFACIHRVRGVNRGCSVNVWNSSTRKRLYQDELDDLNDSVLAFSNDGARLAYVTSTEVVVVECPKMQVVYRGPKDRAASEIFWTSDDEEVLCMTGSGGLAGSLVFLHRVDGSVKRSELRLPIPPGGLVKVKWSSVYDKFFTSNASGEIVVAKLSRNGTERELAVQQHSAHRGTVRGIFCDEDSGILASCGSDQRIRFWNSETMAPIVTYRHAAEVYTLWMSSRSPKIILRSLDKCYVFDRKDVLPKVNQ